MASASSSKDPREVYALKQKAMKYYEENGVPAKMEEILNSMFFDDPPDVFGHLVNFFSKFVNPALLKQVSAVQMFDCNGIPTVQTDVYCTVNNNKKHIVASTIPSAEIKVSPEEREKAEIEIQHSVLAALQLINGDVNNQIEGLDPTNQSDIDDLLLSILEKRKEEEAAKKAQEEENAEENPTPPAPSDDKDKKKSAKKGKISAPIPSIPDKPLEVFVSGCEIGAAVSQAVCACAAITQDIPIYRHVANLARLKGALNEFRIPLPMVTIIQSGRSVSTKVKCVKEYMVVPGINMPVDKSIEHIHNIYKHVAKSLVTKQGPSAKFVNEIGALCPSLDTPTQALDLLQEAINAQGLTIGEDMYLAINAAGNEFFDSERGKYETVTGTHKSPDEMVDFWTDILSKYPSILAIIDPIRGEDIEQWSKLCEKVSEAHYIIGDWFYDRPGLLKNEEISNVRTSGIMMNIERMNTITDIIECANKFEDLKNEIAVSTNQGDVNDTFIVDFAVGLNARFLKIGGPCRGEKSGKLNRLLQIVGELEPALPKPEENEEEATHKEMEGEVESLPAEGEMDTPSLNLPPEEAEQEEVEQKFFTWGGEEKSRLKSHSQFVFPFIENPPPPEVGDEGLEREENKSPSSSSRKSK